MKEKKTSKAGGIEMRDKSLIDLRVMGDNLIGKDDVKAEEILLSLINFKDINPIDLHFTYNSLIKLCYRKRNENDYLERCIEYCQKDIEIFTQFEQASIEEELSRNKQMLTMYEPNDERYIELKQEIDRYKWSAPNIPSIDRLIIIYEKQRKFEDAISICEKALTLNLNTYQKEELNDRLARLEDKQQNPPLVKKVTKDIEPPSLSDNQLELILNKENPQSNNFMITFSKSTSKNFNRALFLAKDADYYYETIDENNETIYQAIFKPENHLAFITLYELIGKWKSTFVFKNGKIIDRKKLGQINYCFGDKLRSASESFCYGASMFTENPFGCHRLMIHSGQKPWYQWISYADRKFVYIDKASMKKQIDEKANTFHLCPAFDYNNIIQALDELPDKIEKKSELYKKLYSESSVNQIILPNMKFDNGDTVDIADSKKLNKQSGCLNTTLIIFALLTTAIIKII